MIKGPWKIAEIDDSRRPYIAMRGLSQSYWEDMPENTAILEGKILTRKMRLLFQNNILKITLT